MNINEKTKRRQQMTKLQNKAYETKRNETKINGKTERRNETCETEINEETDRGKQ